MTLVGMPDFQEQAQWQSTALVDDTPTVPAGATKVYPTSGAATFNVSSWQWAQLTTAPDTGTWVVKLTWYLDAAATKPVGQRTFTVAAVCQGIPQAPNMGPYLRLSVQNRGGAPAAIRLILALANRDVPPWSDTELRPLFAINPQVVATGVTATLAAPFVYAGLCSWWSTVSTADPWIMNLYGVDDSDTRLLLSQWRNNEPGTTGVSVEQNTRRGLLVTPAMRLQLDLVNLAPGNQNFFCALTPNTYR